MKWKLSLLSTISNQQNVWKLRCTGTLAFRARRSPSIGLIPASILPLWRSMRSLLTLFFFHLQWVSLINFHFYVYDAWTVPQCKTVSPDATKKYCPPALFTSQPKNSLPQLLHFSSSCPMLIFLCFLSRFRLRRAYLYHAESQATRNLQEKVI